MDQRINSVVYIIKVIGEPMEFLLSIIPSKEMRERSRNFIVHRLSTLTYTVELIL